MGGLLEPFIDTQKGYKLYVPAGWNKFDADPGVYDIKFQDIITQPPKQIRNTYKKRIFSYFSVGFLI